MPNTHVSVRVSEAVAAALAKRAERAGCSVSEIVRQAVDQQMASELVATKPKPNEGFDPFSKLALAARGSLQAQRDLANEAVRLAVDEPDDFDPSRTLREGLVFARLAAAHGRLEDQGLVIAMLANLAAHEGEHNAPDELAEGMARLGIVADCGGPEGEDAAAMLNRLAGEAHPIILEAAKEYTKRLTGAA